MGRESSAYHWLREDRAKLSRSFLSRDRGSACVLLIIGGGFFCIVVRDEFSRANVHCLGSRITMSTACIRCTPRVIIQSTRATSRFHWSAKRIDFYARLS